MTCPNCGVELDDREKVCSLCGYEFAAATDEEISSDTPVNNPAVGEDIISSPDSKEKDSKKIFGIIIVLTALIVVLGIAAVFLLTDKDSDNSTTVNSTASTTDITTVITTDTTTTTTAAATTTTSVTTAKSTTTQTETTKPDTSKSETAYVKISDGYLNVRKEPDANAEIIGKLSDGEKVQVLRHVDDEWCEIEYNDSKAYVSANYISDTYNDDNDYISVDSSGLLKIDVNILGSSYDKLCDTLNADLPTPQEFPWWGTDLKNADYTYNGIPLCFMFQYDKLVMVIYDIESEFRNDICDAAYDYFGNADYPHLWSLGTCTFEILLDTYATDGTTHFKQQYTYSDMIG